MTLNFRKLTPLLLCVSLAGPAPQILAKKKDQTPPADSEQKRAVHALSRLTFGPSPGDIQQVMAMGVDRWIDLQLHPEKISDDAVEARLSPFRTLHMSSGEIAENFPDNQLLRQVVDGKRPMPSDPARHAVYQVQLERMEERNARKAEAAAPTSAPAPSLAPASETAKTAEELAAAAAASPDANTNGNAMDGMGNGMSASNSEAPAMETKAAADDPEARRREDRLYADLKVQSLVDLPPDQRYRTVMAMSPDEQFAFADSLRGGKGQEFLAGLDPRQKEVLLAMNNPQAVVVDELIQAKLLRAIYSQRQLEEVMTDFWFNHFNVFINKGADRLLITSYERDVIRPHALGRFEDLLIATAKSPAMLFYLDNWLSVGPDSMQALGVPRRPSARGPYRYPPRGPNPNAKRKANSGLNENYGRELLELHTLSVNGGYSQRDVTEVAKVFTGWTIDKPFDGGSFHFDPRMHEPGPKFVLGHRIKPKGEDEGREVLHMLATSPQTAHFISLKLAERFVSDDPPPALVDRMTKTFRKKKGDIREVLVTLFHSPEFWDSTAYRAKVKTPLEFVVSAVRATGAEVDDAMPLARQIANMGMPLYGAQPPTGYSMKSETWVSSAALLNRMNFALALTAGKIRGAKVETAQLAGDASPPADPLTALSALEAKLLAADVSKQTHDSIVAQLAAPATSAAPDQHGKDQQNKDQQSKNDQGKDQQNRDQQNKDQQGKKAQSQPRPPDANMIAGLLLGSPEFQRR